jgi:hypothetical protein
MRNLWKIGSVLLSFSVIGYANAKAIFDITPSATTATVSSTATQDYILTWTIKNNTSSTTPIKFSNWGANINDQAFSVRSTTCNAQVAPNGTCSMTMGIRGAAVNANSVIVSPRFCLPNGQVCATATQSYRLSINRTTTPIPQGSWKVFAVLTSENFPEFVSINYPALALGVVNHDYTPTVYKCANLNSADDCILLGQGFFDYNFETITAMSYAPDGGLYGVFTKPQSDAINPNISYILKIPSGASAWQQVATPVVGMALGLDTQSSLRILFSSGFYEEDPDYGSISIGSAKIYSNNNELVGSQRNPNSASLSAIVDDGLGNIFVAGKVDDHQITPTPEETNLVWLWNTTDSNSATAFTAINMPTNIPLITSMVSDGHGTVYIAGLDIFTDGHVWKYTVASGEFVDTGLSASSVTTLYYSPYGYLLAGGVDNVHYDGAIWYYAQGAWTNLNLTNSTNVVSITADANNDIVATGFDSDNNPNVWVYN